MEKKLAWLLTWGLKHYANLSPFVFSYLVLPVEVVLEQLSELLPLVDVWARWDEVATGEALVEAGVVPPVQLVDGQLPDRVGPRGAVVGIAVALVGHPRSQENEN